MFAFPKLRLAAWESVEVCEEKKCCSADCALTAESRVSCCSTKRTATRAKSSTCSVTTKVVVGLADVAEEVEVDEDADEYESGLLEPVGSDEETGVVDEVSTMIPCGIEEGSEETVEASSRFLLRRGGAVTDGEVSPLVAEGTTSAFASPIRCDRPSKVTRAFSDKQERLAVLNRAKMTVGKSGMEKFVCAAVIRRGIESPSVTLGYSFERVVVVQPVALATVHVEPVKPFMHRHAQLPEERNVLPPFWHAVVGSC